jgi:AraC-like DNA-binding protein
VNKRPQIVGEFAGQNFLHELVQDQAADPAGSWSASAAWLSHRWRMGMAAQLLEQTSFQVSEIAVRVGYGSEVSFSRAFRKARGLSPMQARKRAVPGAPGCAGSQAGPGRR